MKKLVLAFICLISVIYSKAQCPGGQIQVSITVKTDGYGGEGYWELVPTGNACGTGTIFAGGNTNVGCNGAGNQASPPGGYPSDSTFTEGPWCLTLGSSYDIIYNDDWLDGGIVFTVNIGGYPLYSGLAGSGNGTHFTFVANPPPASDVACRLIKTPSYVNYGPVFPKAWVTNLGTDTIHSIDLYYSIDNAAAQLSNISGITINPFDSLLVSATAPWNVSLTDDYSLQMYVNNPNGNPDMNASNDSTQRMVAAGPPIPNIINDYLTGNPAFTVIGNNAIDQVNEPTDLDFHPVLTRYELWVTLRGTANSGGSTVKFTGAGQVGQTSLMQTDGNAAHFMDLPSGIAFSENENFATSPSIYDANHGSGAPFTGPTLWSSDSTIYAHTPPGGNGSHIDMLHQSPYAMGICSEEENIFWVYDNNDKDIVRYDFKRDHGPGNSDHSDGVIRRFEGLGLAGDPNHVIPSHLILDKTEGNLYIADTYNDRILKMDIHSGTFLATLIPYEGLAEYTSWNNVTWSVFVDSGITKPSGIDFIGDRMIVSEYNSGDIVIYDKNGSTGTELGRIHTGTPGVMGVKIGPDGKIWYVNYQTDEVVRIDQLNVGVNELTAANVVLYPNPANDKLNVILNSRQNDAVVTIIDTKGSVIASQSVATGERTLTFDIASLASGVYTMSIRSEKDVVVKRFVKE